FLGYIPTSGQLVDLDETASYRVKIAESKSKTYPLSIQLLDQANNPLNLFGGSYLQSESGVRYPIGSIDLDQGQIDLRTQALDSTGENITFTPPAIPVANGQKLVYHAGLSEASQTLQDGDAFWAIVDPNESGLIRLALSAEQAEAANPAVQDALAHLTATFKGLQIPLTPDGKPSGLQAGQSFSIQTNGSTKTFTFTTDGALYGNWPDGTFAVKLATDSTQEQADEIISAISQANIGLKASYQGSGKIAIGTQSDILITASSSALQAADIPVDIPIGNFEAGVGLVFLDDPNLVDNLPVVYHAVPGKPMRGLVDGRVYHVYNVPNTNYNPVVPQYILTLMDGLEVSSNANSGSFELKITAPNGTSATTVPLAWNISTEDLQSQINSLGLPDVNVRVSGTGTAANPWFIDGVNLDAVALQNSSLSLNGIPTAAKLQQASPQVLIDSDADAGTFTLEVTGNDGVARKTGDLAWNISASQLQVAMNGLALSGVYVNVEGSGTAEDPWLIDGVKPSQIAIDSAKLLKSTKSTDMQMTSARQVQFYNGQSMDDATGHQFPITGSDRDNGTLTIMLPDNAPIVSADDSPLIGDGINAPVVTFEAIPVNTLEIFSIATSGTFTLSYTDASGIEHTSSDLAFDATASQIAAAIFAITGDSVSVTGRGRISSPWMVTGLTVEQITSESKMKNPLGDPTELIGQISDGAGYRIWVEHVQGGTFTLTLDNTLEHVTTEPISFNATASDLFTALRALPGITAQVTGAGTGDDPWIVHTGALPIRTGDPLVFRDSWGMPGLGMIDGRTYYAIVLEQSDDPREITLQLTATLDGATGGSSDWGNIATNQHIEMRPYLPLVPASAPGLNGKPVTLYGTSGQVPDGITITAGLDSSHSIGSYANLGGFPLLSYALGVNQLGSLINKKNDIAGADSWIENLIKNRIPSEDKDVPNQWEIVGAAALQWIDNKVEVIVGRTAEVGTDGTLTIHSDINQTLSTVSNAGLSKTNSKNENWAVAVAFAFSNVSNTSKAIVSSNAIVTGGYGVDINSNVSYVPPAHWPFIRQVDQLFRKDQEFWKHILGEMETLYSDIFLGVLGLLTANFNTVANVGIARIGGDKKNSEDVMKFVLTGSFAYEIIHNENLAQIADGAKLNVPDQQFTTYSMVTNSEEEKPTSPQNKWLADNRTQTVGFNPDSNFGPDARIRLRYDTELTEWIGPEATASEVQSALENLKLIGVGNVSVSVDPSRPYEWKIQLLNKVEDFTRRQIAIQTKNIDNPKLYQTDEDNNTPTHGVSVVAETNAKQWGLGGQLYFSLPYIIHGLVSGDGSGIAKAWREGGPFRSAAKNAFGGSVSLLTMDGSTQALLGGFDSYYDPADASTTPYAQSTEVYYGTGNEGGLRISANTRNGVVQVAQASANSSGFGFEGSVAYVTMGEPHSDIKSDDRRQKTHAKMIASTVPLKVTPISRESDGGISVKANDQSFGWAITGSLLIGQSKGIGLSGSVIELTRDVQASIGSQLASIDPYLPTDSGNLASAVPGSHISTNGSIDVQSTLSGTVVPLAVVGEFSVRSSEHARDEGAGNAGEQGDNSFFRKLKNIFGGEKKWFKLRELPKDIKSSVWEKENKWLTSGGNDGKFGFFISGDFSGAFVEDQVYSYVDASGNLIGANAANSKLDVSSGNSTTINPGAGDFSLQFSKESTSNKTGGFAGSVAWADVNSDVQAWVQSASLDQLGLNVSATNNKKIGSGAAGLQVDSPTGFDLQVMGSVVINTIDNTTKAWIDQANHTNAGDISVRALQADEIFGLAGTAQFSIAPFRGKTVFGFGMSAAWSEINNTTDASIQGSTISQTQGNTLVSANDFTESEARSFGVQVVVTAGNVIEIGGMWTANLLFPNTSSTISDSQIYSTSELSLAPKFTATAWLNPWMVSFAGYFSLGVSTGEKD
ncbi:MAG: hypothetical protein FJ308_14830, partial [Planctomycetes bacterium]|nr:hypothetical protein [Planctomycetota bacterium]